MTLIPVILLAVIFLLGAVTLGIGHRGWNWGTVAAAWLVLLAALGFTFLVGMLGQRERAWRSVIASYEASIAKERDALVPTSGGSLQPDGQQLSLPRLEAEKANWQRIRNRVDTWQGRSWESASFQPPRANAKGSFDDGSLTLEGIDSATINPGSELYVFDQAPIEKGGTFVGAFRVKSADKNVLQIAPAAEPDDADKKVWATPHPEVSIYENLPIDSSLAFVRTAIPVATEEAGAAAPEEDAAGTPGALPAGQKNDPEALLQHLQALREELRLHNTPVGTPAEPAADGAAAVPHAEIATDPSKSATPPLGVRFARVTFNKAFEFTWLDGTRSTFQKGEVVAAFPIEQLELLTTQQADFSREWNIPPGLYWANVEFKVAHSFPRQGGEPSECEAGSRGQFDLETANALQQQGIVEITSVIYRRPLSDAYVALRGAGDEQRRDAKPLPYNVSGLVALRRILAEDIRSIASAESQLNQARLNVDSEQAIRNREKKELTSDGTQWADDVTAAKRTADAFESRTLQARRELEATEKAVVLLGQELTESMAQLTEAIDQASPAPVQPAPPTASP